MNHKLSRNVASGSSSIEWWRWLFLNFCRDVKAKIGECSSKVKNKPLSFFPSPYLSYNALLYVAPPFSTLSYSPLLFPYTVQSNLFIKKYIPPSSPDHGRSWQVSCIFRFATVWLWRIILLKNYFQLTEQITELTMWMQKKKDEDLNLSTS